MELIFKDFIYLSKEESETILKLRNSEYVRKNMRSSDIIAPQDHRRWMEKLKSDESSLYYAIFYDGSIVGSINITQMTPTKEQCSWGLYFQEGTNPLVASISAFLSIERVFNDFEIKKIAIEVKATNTNAYNFDLHLGFIEDGRRVEKEEYILMSLNKERWESIQNKPLLKTIRKKVDKVEYRFIDRLTQ